MLKPNPTRCYHVEITGAHGTKHQYWVVGETTAGKLRARRVQRDGKLGPITTQDKPS